MSLQNSQAKDPMKETKEIKMIKRTGPNNSDAKKLSHKTIDAALQSLRGDVWVSECLLVVTPETGTMESSPQFEMHGIDKIYSQFLGTIFISREALMQFQESGKFENYSMVFIKTPLDPNTCLKFLVSHSGDPDEFGTGTSVKTRRERRKLRIEEQESEPTINELVLRLKGCSKNESDLTKFFDIAEEQNFSITIRPDFINCSNKLILDCFIFKTDYIGSLALSNREISNQIDKHAGLINNLVIVEDTNELILPAKVATFIRNVASFLRLLYVYDYISEVIYRIVHKI